MKFKKVAPAIHLSSTSVTYRDIYGGVHTSQVTLRIDARTKGRIRVDRASFGMWEAIDNNWLGCKTLVAARKIAEDWATRANAQATLSPLES